MTIWFATGNIHKKKELSEILSAHIESKIGFELKIPADAGLIFDPNETWNSFLDNALIKAEALYRLLEERRPDARHHGVWRKGDPVIADDSGICVDALDGRPGIHSARYCGSGITVSDRKLLAAERNALLLAELGDNPLRSARFVCAMVLYYRADRFFAAQETMEGEIVKNAEAMRGQGGFGYDPMLFIPELGRTVAELTEDEKNRWSHRGKAGRVISGIVAGF